MASIDAVTALLTRITGSRGVIPIDVLRAIQSYDPTYTGRSKIRARSSLAERLVALTQAQHDDVVVDAVVPEPVPTEPVAVQPMLEEPTPTGIEAPIAEPIPILPVPAPITDADRQRMLRQRLQELHLMQDRVTQQLADIELRRQQSIRREQFRPLLAELPTVAAMLMPDATARDEQRRIREAMEEQLQQAHDYVDPHLEELNRDFNAKYRQWDTYEAFQADQSREHQQALLEIIQENYQQDRGWVFANLDELNVYTSHQFFDWLRPVWVNEIGRIAATQHYIIHYQLADDSWRSVPLNRESYEQILRNIDNHVHVQ
jgi:hypothetical protein